MTPATDGEFEGRNGGSRPRRAVACNSCRMRKVRCDGERPCTNCVDHDTSCTYTARQRTRQKRADITDRMAERLSRVEALLQAVDNSSTHSTLPSIRGPEIDNSIMRPRQFSENQIVNEVVQPWTPYDSHGSNPSPSRSKEPMGPHLAPVKRNMQFVEPPTAPESRSDQASLQSRRHYNIHHILQNYNSISSQAEATLNLQPSNTPRLPSPSTIFSGEMGVSTTAMSERDLASNATGTSPEVYSVYSGENSNWEYHGPRSFLSICSPSGIQWVSEKTCSHTFQDSATMLSKDMPRCFRMEMKVSGERTPEPSADVARKYTQTYFEFARETTFEMVNRAWFESRLESHLSSPSSNEDPAGYALRNAIYASGARIELAKAGKFSEALQTAWSFFSNSFSVHTELLYFQTSLTAIQALIIMGYFSEGIGNPCLEYMLSTAALRLACFRGLHRQPVPSWNMSEEQQQIRNRIFWAAYCLEKNCSARGSRPSMIDDDHISVQMPDSNLLGTSSYHIYSIALIRLAHMASLISKKFSHLETIQKPQDLIIQTIAELNENLESLKEFVERLVDLDSPLEPCRQGINIDLQQAIYIRMAYYVAVLDTHAPVSYPWSLRILKLADHPQLQAQVQSSAETVVKTSRNIILGAQFIRLDASTAILMAFHAPLFSLINVFVHVLMEPGSPTVDTDLSLIDIGVAHFLRLELSADSKISFPFPKDLAKLAQQTVQYSKTASQLVHKAATTRDKSSSFVQDTGNMETGGLSRVNDLAITSTDGAVSNLFDLDLENCSTFLPGPEFDDYAFNFVD